MDTWILEHPDTWTLPHTWTHCHPDTIFSRLRLEPANPEYEDVYIQPDVFEEVRVLGRYIGHVNKSGIYRKSA